MGRTQKAVTPQLEEELSSLKKFRRALRQADQRALDDLLVGARLHLSAIAYAAHVLPFEAMLLSMLLESHKKNLNKEDEIEYLRKELEKLQKRINNLEQTGND
jgi:hypothetical protein